MYVLHRIILKNKLRVVYLGVCGSESLIKLQLSHQPGSRVI